MTVLTCDRADLAWALKAVLPHVLRDRGYLPSLEGVRLEASPEDKTLYVVATDRYTLGVARVDAVIAGAAATIIGRSDAGEMLRRLRAKGECELAVYDDGELCLDWRARWQKSPELGEYPDWRKLVADALRYNQALPGPKYGCDAEFMARFAPAMRDGMNNGRPRKTPLVFMPVARKPSGYGVVQPLTVILGDHFAGLVAHVRLDDAGLFDPPAVLRRWRELLPAGGTQ